MRILVHAIFIALLITVHLALTPYCADDAYLHFRIAKNFLEFGQPYFTPDAPVMATSSSVWTLLLSLVFWLCGVSPKAIAILNAFFIYALALLASRFASGAPKSDRILIALTAISVALPASLQLMETPLALFLALLGYFLYQNGRYVGFAFLTLACFSRLELCVLLGACLADNFFTRRVVPQKTLLAIGLTLAPLMIFDLYYFGTLIPQTVHAKAVVYSLSSGEFFSIAALGLFGKYLFINYPLLCLACLATSLLAAAWWIFQRQLQRDTAAFSREILLLLAAGILIFVTYATKRVYIFPWYVPLYTLPALLALTLQASKERSTAMTLLLVSLSAGLSVQASRDIWAGLSSKPALFSEYEGGVRALTYRSIGRDLNRSCQNCSLLAAEVGALGFEFSGPVTDAAGLTSPEAVAHHLKLPEQASTLGGIIPPSLALSTNPDYIVGTKELLGLVFADPELSNKYNWRSIPLIEAIASGDELFVGVKKS